MPSGRSLRAGKAVIEMSLLTGGVSQSLKQIKREMLQVGSALKNVGQIGLGIGSAISAPFAAAVTQAASAQETLSKFGVVFGEMAPMMKAFGDNFAETVGRSKYEVAGMLASFQDLLQPMGMSSGAAAEMSKQLSALAVDLASFNNMSDADVVRDLQAALTGSGEVMKKYGVIVSAAAVNQELLNRSLDPKTATEAEKAAARLAIIMRGTVAAHGDAIRTADSFTNRLKALQANIKDTSIEVGTTLLPTVTALLARIQDVAKRLSEWIAANIDTVKTVAKVGATVTAAGAAMSTAGVAITGITMAVSALTAAVRVLTFSPAVAGLALLGVTALAVTGKLNDLNEAYARLTAPSGGGDVSRHQKALEAALAESTTADALSERKDALKSELDGELEILQDGLEKQRKTLEQAKKDQEATVVKTGAAFYDPFRPVIRESIGNIAHLEARINKLNAMRAQVDAAQLAPQPAAAGPAQTPAVTNDLVQGTLGAAAKGVMDAFTALGKKTEQLGAKIAEAKTRVEQANAAAELDVDRLLKELHAQFASPALQLARPPEAMFDTRLAQQMMGRSDDEQLRELRRARETLERIERDGGGIPVG